MFYILTKAKLTYLYQQLKTKFAALNHSHTVATKSAAGFMSAADKTKLDGLGTTTVSVSKTTFTSDDESWVEGGIGYTLTVATSSTNILNVWRTLSDGTNEIVVTGISTTENSITIETIDKFDGFILCLNI